MGERPGQVQKSFQRIASGQIIRMVSTESVLLKNRILSTELCHDEIGPRAMLQRVGGDLQRSFKCRQMIYAA